jgi:tRNA (guanine37-N1)-methyltransferase
MLCPQGEKLSQGIARELAGEKRLVLLAGHYEGFDERIREGLRPREISIGDYVLSGGEVPAMVVIDAVVRLLPGVLGDDRSTEEESFSAGLLEYYTRPREFEGMAVPEALLSGNHREIAKWRAAKALERTRERRKDLLE